MREPVAMAVGVFAHEEDLRAAIAALRALGVPIVEAYSPRYVEGLHESLRQPDRRVGVAALIGGALGGATGFFMQVYANVYSYPINVAGRPLFSWPSFVPITFELSVLGATFAALGAFFFISKLPRLHRPIFEADHFELVSQDRFALAVETGKSFAPDKANALFRAHGAECVSEVIAP